MNIDKFGNHVHKRLRLTDHILFSKPLDSVADKKYVEHELQDLKKYIDQKLSGLLSRDQVLIEIGKEKKSLLKAVENFLKDNFYSKSQVDSIIKSKIKHE